MAGELAEVLLHIGGIALQLTHERGKEVLQAPAGHDSIETEDNGRGKNAQIAYQSP